MVPIKLTLFLRKLINEFISTKIHKKYLGTYIIIKRRGLQRYDVVKIGTCEGLVHISSGTDFIKPWMEQFSEYESTEPKKIMVSQTESKVDAV